MATDNHPRHLTVLRKTDLRRSHLERSRRAVWNITDETGRVESDSDLDRILFDMPGDNVEFNGDCIINP